MAQPTLSDVTTHGVRVGAVAFYLPQESSPEQDHYVWGYRVLIVNDSEQRVQLLSRHWVIIDAEGRGEEVRGPGVVGETPTLDPGQAFKYVSGCPLSTEWGTMEGEYTMLREDGSTFEAKIGRFYLTTRSMEPDAEGSPR